MQAIYDAGYVASEQAYPRDSNPYKPFTMEHQQWDGGWCQAIDDLCGT